jgi:hypothetical protein
MEISGPGGGFGEEGAVGGISGVLQLRLLCSLLEMRSFWLQPE